MTEQPYRSADRRFVPPAPMPRCPCCGRGPDAAAIDALVVELTRTGGEFDDPRVPEDLVLFLREAQDEVRRAYAGLLIAQTDWERELFVRALERGARMRTHAVRLLTDCLMYLDPLPVVVDRRLTESELAQRVAAYSNVAYASAIQNENAAAGANRGGAMNPSRRSRSSGEG